MGNIPGDEPPDGPSSDESNDRRVLYFIVGGILLAFALGFTLLIVAMVVDWK